MSFFKIKISPIIKVSNWTSNRVGTGRIQKTCEICGSIIPIGSSAWTFQRKKKKGISNIYISRYSCIGRCRDELALKLTKETENERLENSTDSPTDAG